MRISHPSRRDLLKLGALGLGSAALPLTRLRLGLADNGSESSPSPIDPPFTHSLTPEGVPPVLARVPGGPPPGVIVEVNDPRLANPDATASPFRIRHAGANTDFYDITMRKKTVRIPGVVYPAGVRGTDVWAYVAPGHPEGVLLGPTIKSEAITSFLQGVTARDEDPPRISFDPLQRLASARPFYGRPAIVRMTNQLFGKDARGEDIRTTVHLHGGHQGPDDDGYANDMILPAGSQIYQFQNEPNTGQGATLWYHDHTEDFTGRNVWMGLAGFYILEDDLDKYYQETGQMPRGLAGDPLVADPHDIPLVVQDRRFDPRGQLNYDAVFDEGGVFGDAVMVNGVVQPFFSVDTGQYRLRILNGSNVRVYSFSLRVLGSNTRLKMTQIATEAGFLPHPVDRDVIEMASAERVEVIVDFTGLRGKQVLLENSGDEQAPGGRTAQIMLFKVERDSTTPPIRVPDPLRIEADYFNPSQDLKARGLAASIGRAFLDLRRYEGSVPPNARRTWEFNRSNGEFSINGRQFAGPCRTHGEPERIDAIVREGTSEVWEVTNSSGGWYHPVHIHDNAWQVLTRNGQPPPPWERGWKETFFLRQDTVRVITHFEAERADVAQFPNRREFRGTYVFHCHVIEHEDHMMMSQFSVVGPDGKLIHSPVGNCPPPVRD